MGAHVDEVITVSDSKGLDEFYSPSIDESETEDFLFSRIIPKIWTSLRVIRITQLI